MSAESISVSVVVPTLNSASVLENCLNSVRAQTLAPEEIVAGPGAGSGTDATITETGADDDPQLAAAIQMAKQMLRGVNK